MRKLLSIVLVLAVWIPSARGQMYAGMSGLVHVPSAEMPPEGEAGAGGYYMHSAMLPSSGVFRYGGKAYGTAAFHLSVTPFRWVEVSYVFTMLKTLAVGHTRPRYNQKDRYIAVKLNPLREGKWVPAVAVGASDFLSSATKRHAGSAETSGYFSHIYAVVTKHISAGGLRLGASVAWRHSLNGGFRRWHGVAGGITVEPLRIPGLRVMGEWTGREVNIGADIVLWRHLRLQAALVGCSHFSGGIGYRVNLF